MYRKAIRKLVQEGQTCRQHSVQITKLYTALFVNRSCFWTFSCQRRYKNCPNYYYCCCWYWRSRRRRCRRRCRRRRRRRCRCSDLNFKFLHVRILPAVLTVCNALLQMCSCGRRPHCIHILFVMLRVLKISHDDPLLLQNVLENDEVCISFTVKL